MRVLSRPKYVTWAATPFLRAQLDGFEACAIPDDLLPLDGLRGLPKEPPDVTGIYFLWRGPQLIYIGSTREDFASRMFDHKRAQLGIRKGPRYPFTHCTCMVHGIRGLQELEYRYINAYRPPFNTQTEYSGWGKRVPERSQP